jgi:uncharacterized protein
MNTNDEQLVLKPFIDSDSHIEEHDGVFDYLDKEYQHRRPAIINIDGLVKHRPTRNRVWLIDGEIRPKLFGNNPSCYATPPTSDFAKQKPVSVSVQGLMNPDEYVDCLKNIDLDVAVIYPTLFLHPLTQDPLFEAALMRSYNTYMAKQYGQHPTRIKWGALIPLNAPMEAVAEIKRVKALGASSIMVLPAAGTLLLHDRMFDPIYAEMVKQNIPLAIHVGYAHQGINNSCQEVAAALVLNFEMSMMFGLFSVLAGGILDRFPELKIGFLEAGAVWLPTFLDRADKWRLTPTAEVWPAKKAPLEYIRDHEVYFTIEGDEDNLLDFIKLVGANRIIGSADFPHVHYEGGKLGETFSSIKDRSDLTIAEKQLILSKNAQQFYNI